MLVTVLKFTAPHGLHSELAYVTDSILHDPASSCLCRLLHAKHVLLLQLQILKRGQRARSTWSAGLYFLPEWHFHLMLFHFRSLRDVLLLCQGSVSMPSPGKKSLEVKDYVLLAGLFQGPVVRMIDFNTYMLNNDTQQQGTKVI